MDRRRAPGEVDREGLELGEIRVRAQRAFLYSSAVSFSFAWVPA